MMMLTEILSKRQAPVQFHEIKGAMGACEVKATVSERRIEFYSAAFGNVDETADVIARGAFAKTINERGPFGSKLIKGFFNHVVPIGMPELLREDERGLLAVIKVSNTAMGDEALQLTADGVAAHGSIGYDVITSLDEERNGQRIRHLKELKLFEVSPVYWPANEATSILSVKSLDRVEHVVASLPMLGDLLKRRNLSQSEQQLVEQATAFFGDLFTELKALHQPEPGSSTHDGPSIPTPDEPESPTPKGQEPPTVEPERGAEILKALQALHKGIEARPALGILKPLVTGVSIHV